MEYVNKSTHVYASRRNRNTKTKQKTIKLFRINGFILTITDHNT